MSTMNPSAGINQACKDFAKAKAWAYGDPESFQRLIDLLVETTAEYLIRQVEAGAEALQLFDSWAGDDLRQQPAYRCRGADDGRIIEQIEKKWPHRGQAIRTAKVEKDDRRLAHTQHSRLLDIAA